VLTDTYGWEAHAYVVLDAQGQPQAGIPFCRIADMMASASWLCLFRIIAILSLPTSNAGIS